MSQFEDEWGRRRLYLRHMFLNAPDLSTILESPESLEQSPRRSDAVGELVIERTARHRPADDEPEEVYDQLERKIRKYWRILSNSKFTDNDNDSVELDTKIYSRSDVSTAASVIENNASAIESSVNSSMLDDEIQLGHESTDEQTSVTSDTDEEDMKDKTDDMDQEMYEEVEEEIGEEMEEEIVEGMKVAEEMVGDIGHKMGEHIGKLDKNMEKETENETDSQEVEEAIAEEVEEEVVEDVEKETVGDIGHKMREHMGKLDKNMEKETEKEIDSQEFEDANISNLDRKKEELNQKHATNQSDLGSSDDTTHLNEREISNSYQNSDILNAPSHRRRERHENEEITFEALVARNSKSEPTKAQLKVYEDKRDDDVENTTGDNHSEDSEQLSERQDENVGEQGSHDGEKQNTGDDHHSEKNLSLKEREKNSEIESQVSDKRDEDDEANLRAAHPELERDDINEEGSQDSDKSDDAQEDMLNADIPVAEERAETTEIENNEEKDRQDAKYEKVINRQDTDTLDETSSDEGVRLIIQEVEVEVMRSNNPSPAVDSFHREVERNSSTSTIRRPSLNAKRSLVVDQYSSVDLLADEIIMANESREEILRLVTTPTPLRSSGSKTAGSDPATEATTPKRSRKTEDVGVQTEQNIRTAGTQTDDEMFRFRNLGGYIYFWFN